MSGLTELALLGAGVGNRQDRGQQRKQRARPHGGAARAGEGPARHGLLHAAAALLSTPLQPRMRGARGPYPRHWGLLPHKQARNTWELGAGSTS